MAALLVQVISELGVPRLLFDISAAYL